jgi:hypothetical protein
LLTRRPRLATEQGAIGDRTMKLALCVVVPFALAAAACGGGESSAPALPASTGMDAGAVTTPDAAVATPDASTPVDAGPDVDNGSPSTTYPAPHPAPPQVVEGGGVVLAHPKIVPIFFSDYDPTLQSGATDFVTKLAMLQSYTTATLSEYGVLGLTAGTPIILAETAPVGTNTTPYDDSSIQSWLTAKLTSNDPQFGPPDPSVVYTIFFPASTIISLGQDMSGQASLSCQEFGGYHSDIDIPANADDAGVGDAEAGATQSISYAVIPSCSNFNGLNGIDMITAAASHEIAEASTDPFPEEMVTGYSDVDQNHIVWDFVLGGGEIGDMCAQYPDAFFKPTGFDYYVQRIWSNAAALAGHDPCIPADGPVYFNSAFVLPDMVTLPFGGGIATQGVKVLTGDSATVEIDLFSDGATTGPWTVAATEPTMGTAASLDLSLDRSTGVNGEKLHLTIKTVTPNSYGLSVVQLTSTLGSQTAYWAGLVQTK